MSTLIFVVLLFISITIVGMTVFEEFKWANQDGRRPFHDKFGKASFDSGFLGAFLVTLFIGVIILFR